MRPLKSDGEIGSFDWDVFFDPGIVVDSGNTDARDEGLEDGDSSEEEED